MSLAVWLSAVARSLSALSPEVRGAERRADRLRVGWANWVGVVGTTNPALPVRLRKNQAKR